MIRFSRNDARDVARVHAESLCYACLGFFACLFSYLFHVINCQFRTKTLVFCFGLFWIAQSDLNRMPDVFQMSDNFEIVDSVFELISVDVIHGHTGRYVPARRHDDKTMHETMKLASRVGENQNLVSRISALRDYQSRFGWSPFCLRKGPSVPYDSILQINSDPVFSYGKLNVTKRWCSSFGHGT